MLAVKFHCADTGGVLEPVHHEGGELIAKFVAQDGEIVHDF